MLVYSAKTWMDMGVTLILVYTMNFNVVSVMMGLDSSLEPF